MNNQPEKRNCLQTLWKQDLGLAISAEVILVGIVLVFGMLVGLASMRDSVISELSDMAGSVQDLNQSFAANGTSSDSSATAGSNFFDQFDIEDDAEDPIGAIDNGIRVDVPPRKEKFPVSTVGLVAILDFVDDASDGAPFGPSNNGTLRGGATVAGGNLVLDGINDRVTIGNSNEINLGTHAERTIHVEFTPTDVTARQVVYEEGGGVRGLNIYIEGGQLYLGAYNIPENGFAPTFLSTPITAGQPISAAIVINGGPTVQPDAFSGFVNGSLIGRAPGSQLFQHGGGIGIGGVNGNTLFHSGGSGSGTLNGSAIGSVQSSNGAFFGGTIGSVSIYNRPLSDAEISSLD